MPNYEEIKWVQGASGKTKIVKCQFQDQEDTGTTPEDENCIEGAGGAAAAPPASAAEATPPSCGEEPPAASAAAAAAAAAAVGAPAHQERQGERDRSLEADAD